MPIARDATSSGENGGTTTSLTVSHTCTGSNLLLIVSISVNGTSTDIVTGVTYNTVAMTRINSAPVAGLREYFYSLVAPATGAHNIVGSISGGNRDIRLTACSYTGTAQTGVPDSSNTGTASNPSSSPLTVSTVVAALGCWLVGGTLDDTVTLAAGTGTNLVINSGATGNKFFDSNGTVGQGSHSLQVTWTGTVHDTGMCIASIAPAPHNYSFNSNSLRPKIFTPGIAR